MVKIELSENRRLEAGSISNVVLVSCGDSEESNIITLGMYMPISILPPLVCIGIRPHLVEVLPAEAPQKLLQLARDDHSAIWIDG